MKSMFKGALGALIVVLALSGLTAASALAAGAPIVETQPAANITPESAILHGKINPNGATTKYYFEYGTTIAYGSKTPESGGIINEVNGFKAVLVLEWDTTYHYRVAATNSYGTSYGADAVFTTTGSRPEFVRPEKENYPVSYTGTYSGLTWIATGGTFQCSEDTISGEITGPTTIKNATVKFRGCKASGKYCPTGEGGVEEGSLTTHALKGTLVYLSISAKTVGIDLTAQTGTSLANYRCLGEKDEVRGSIVLPITPVNTMTTHFTVKSNGKSEEYEIETGEKRKAGLETNFPTSAFEPLSWIFESTFLTGGQIEVKA
jgi:hypothetical protein